MTNMFGLISSDMHSHSFYLQFSVCAVYIELIVVVQAPSRTMLVGDEETFMHGQLGKDMNFELLCVISNSK